MVNDSISDLLIRIKNSYLARHKTLSAPYFKLGEKLINILVKEGYIEDVKVEGIKKKNFLIKLKYDKKTPALTNLERVSKPGLRIYVRKNNLPRVLKGLGITILSTSKGLMTGKDARKRGLGGEVLCRVW